MGRGHGEQAADLIGKYLLWIERLTRKPRDLLCANAMALLPYIEDLSPEYVREIRGLADGAGISFEEAVLCQVRAEAAGSGAEACTAFALKGEATADGSVLIGQNQDLEPEYADVAILLRVRPSDGRPSALMFTFAGQLGYSGMNELGLAHFANALYGFEWKPGLPHYPLKRAVLERRSVSEALSLLERHRTCSAGNMVLADGSGAIADVEIRPEGVASFEDSHRDRRLHTNHYLAGEFWRHEDGRLADSAPRLRRIRELVERDWGGITVETLKGFLADHEGDPGGICRHGANGMHSVSGYIAEPARRGHGCLGSWNAYEVWAQARGSHSQPVRSGDDGGRARLRPRSVVRPA